MNRLFSSSKFWLSAIGATVGIFSYWFTKGDATFSMFMSGLFGAGIVGNAAEDMITKYKGNEESNNQ